MFFESLAEQYLVVIARLMRLMHTKLIMNIPETEAYLKTCQTSMMELFTKIIRNEFQPLTTFTESLILHVYLGSEYASDLNIFSVYNDFLVNSFSTNVPLLYILKI